MGQAVRNVVYTPGNKFLNFDGQHGRTYTVHFDDVDDSLRQGDRKGNKPASSGNVTIGQATGTGTFDTTSKSFVGGSVHTVRFVDPNNGHVTSQSTFTA